MTEYNGWKNYETWTVGLWIDNDPGLWANFSEVAQWSFDSTDPDEPLEDRRIDARNDLAEEMKDSFREQADELAGASVFADLLGSALDMVDWQEIAEHLLEGVDIGSLAFDAYIYETPATWGETSLLNENDANEAIERLRNIGADWMDTSLEDCTEYSFVEDLGSSRAMYESARDVIVTERQDNGAYNLLAQYQDRNEAEKWLA